MDWKWCLYLICREDNEYPLTCIMDKEKAEGFARSNSSPQCKYVVREVTSDRWTPKFITNPAAGS